MAKTTDNLKRGEVPEVPPEQDIGAGYYASPESEKQAKQVQKGEKKRGREARKQQQSSQSQQPSEDRKK